MNPTTGGTNLVNNSYTPPKKWEEITSEEKIERMREIIKSLQHWVARNQSDTHYIKDNFAKHSHSDKGIVVPFNEYNYQNSLNGVAKTLDEGYF